jgi:hypothetical protein
MYDQDAAKGSDVWGKLYFHNTPFSDDGPYYVGLVTPVIHYCMGGIAVSTDGSVLQEGLYADGSVLQEGLYAACFRRGSTPPVRSLGGFMGRTASAAMRSASVSSLVVSSASALPLLSRRPPDPLPPPPPPERGGGGWGLFAWECAR